MQLSSNHNVLWWRRTHLFSAVVVPSAFLAGYFSFLQNPSLTLFFFYLPALFFMLSSLVFFYEGKSNFFTYPTLENIIYTLFRFGCVAVTWLFIALVVVKKSPFIFPSNDFFSTREATWFLSPWNSHVLYFGLSVVSAFVVGVGLWKIMMSFGLLATHHAQRVGLHVALLIFLVFVLAEVLFFLRGVFAL